MSLSVYLIFAYRFSTHAADLLRSELSTQCIIEEDILGLRSYSGDRIQAIYLPSQF